LAVAGDADAGGIDIFAPGGIAEQEVDVESDIDRTLLLARYAMVES